MRLSACSRLGLLLVALAPMAVYVDAARAQEETGEATQLYNSAVGLHKSEAFDLAGEEWAKFAQDYPTDPRVARALHYLGICYSRQNKLDEAAKTFAQVVADHPQFDLLEDTLLNLGLTQYNIAQSGKPETYDAAAKTFGTLATKYPDGKHTADAVYYHGECLYNRGKKQEAAEKYAAVLAKEPGHKIAPRALFALAVTQTDLGQHETALASYADFLKRFPADPLAAEAALWQGESFYALKQYDNAIKSYATSATAAGFDMADYASLRQADALAALKKYAEAAALYASVPAKYPNSQYVGRCTMEAGKKYHAAGDFASARKHLDQVVATGGPSATEAAHWICRGLLSDRKATEALAVAEKALPKAEGTYRVSLLMDQADAVYEIPERQAEAGKLYAAVAKKYPDDPAAPEALYLAAFAAMNASDHATVIRLTDTFTAKHAGHDLAVGVGHVRAESLLLSGKFAEAESLFGQLLTKYPNDQDAEIWKVHLGSAMYLQKKYQETVAALKPIVSELSNADLLAEAWYRIGRSEAALKQFDAAVPSLEASLKAQPKWKLSDDVRLVLAYCHQQAGRLDEAAESARTAIKEFPGSKLLDMAHYRLGECARLGGDLKTAVTEYELILANWPDSLLTRQTLYGLAWAQLGGENHAEAEKTFGKLIEKYPNDPLLPRAQYGRGMARRALKQYAPAAEDMAAFLTSNPSAADTSRARHVLGLCQKGLKQYEEAVATFEKLFEDDPQYADADSVSFELGWALKLQDQNVKAVAVFAKLAKDFPESSLAADSHYLVGDFAYEQKGYKLAASSYYAAMDKAGKTALGEEASYKLGLAYYMLDDLKNAAQTFKYQRVTWPEGTLIADGTFMQAECLFKQKSFDEALPLYELVENSSNKEVEVLTLLHAGHCAGELEQWKKSLDLLTSCVEKFPDSRYLTQALYEQGWAQQNLDKKDEAIAIYQQVIAKARDDERLDQESAAKAQYMIGNIQFERKQHADAVKSYFRVTYNYGYPEWRAQATYEAGRCFEVLGKTSQALNQYQALVKDYPEHEKVPYAKQRIEALQ